MLFFDDSAASREILEEGQRAEEGVRGHDLADALLCLLAFGECQKQN